MARRSRRCGGKRPHPGQGGPERLGALPARWLALGGSGRTRYRGARAVAAVGRSILSMATRGRVMPGTSDEEQRWCVDRRREVIDYLDGANLAHGGVGEAPAWSLHPYLSVWAVHSLQSPERVGWWAICGDCPTDYVACAGDRTPRTALREIAAQWRTAAPFLARGEQHPDFVVGRPDHARELAPMLAARAEALEILAADDGLWDQPAPDDRRERP